jgi:hypothetical protein
LPLKVDEELMHDNRAPKAGNATAWPCLKNDFFRVGTWLIRLHQNHERVAEAAAAAAAATAINT